MAKVHFGVMMPQIKRSWSEASVAAANFEAMGYDSLWVNDHLYGPQSPSIPILEAWSMVAGLAAITSRVEIGTLVTPVGMRNPAHLGKVVATVDQMSGGRVIPGIGAGWMPREFTDFGVPYLDRKGRLGQLREAAQLLRRMWGEEESVTFEGQYFQTKDLVTLPKPARQPRLLIGGAGEQVTMKIAARYADIWNNLAGSQDQIAHKVEVLREHCATVGRDASEITVAQQCLVTIAKDDAEAGPMIEVAQKIFGGHMGNPKGELALSGTPNQIVDRIGKHVDAGCVMFNIEFFGRDTREPAELFASTVLSQFR